MIENPNAPFMFVIDTDKYAGNFERPMTAYMTGRYGDCGVGDDEAKLFYQEMDLNDDWDGVNPRCYEDLGSPFVFVIEVPDNHGCHRPTTIYPTPGWVNNGSGGHFREGEEEEALKARNLKISVDLGFGSKWKTGTDEPLKKYPAYQSVAIFMNREPTKEEAAILKERAHKFIDYIKNANSHIRQELNIEGFRLIKTEIQRTETEMPV